FAFSKRRPCARRLPQRVLKDEHEQRLDESRLGKPGGCVRARLAQPSNFAGGGATHDFSGQTENFSCPPAVTIMASVEDSGPGIDPLRLGYIFDAFVTTKSHGMGLGLAICRMIVERHKGRLVVSPAISRGSIFRVVLPIESANGERHSA